MDDPWLIAILAAFVPALLWLVFFYTRDRYEREPTRAVLIFFAMGAVLAVPLAIIVGIFILPLVGGLGVSESDLVGAFILMFLIAGLPEEVIKGGLAAFRARREPDVDEPADPMIYFTSLGLGFGALETVLYIVGTYAEFLPVSEGAAIEAAFLVTAPLRAITVTMGHGLWTGIAGYCYSARRFGFGRRSGLVVGVLLAAVFHAAYNAAVGFDLFAGIVVLIVTAGVYGVMLRSALARSPHAVIRPPQAPSIAGGPGETGQPPAGTAA
ncbi:MAG TPA: PrsW family glutamic-type intramembrane protease [Candidatus Limnocylindria bacterium]|nr:PrsW family glutamic-type intramembrane protease [Candidatus Limnocylindria bacterium]